MHQRGAATDGAGDVDRFRHFLHVRSLFQAGLRIGIDAVRTLHGLGHAGLGSVDWPLLAKLLIGSLPGIWLGSHLMLKTSDRVIRGLLSLLLAYAGTKLLAL